MQNEKLAQAVRELPKTKLPSVEELKKRIRQLEEELANKKS